MPNIQALASNQSFISASVFREAILSRVGLDEFVFFVRSLPSSARLGQEYLKRYACNGYTNKELFFSSNSKAFQYLLNYTVHGVLGPLASKGDE